MGLPKKLRRAGVGLLISFITLILVGTPLRVLAASLSPDQIKAFQSGVRYFNTDVDSCDGVTSNTGPLAGQIDVASIASKYGLQSAIVKQVGGSVLGSQNADQSPAKVASVLKLIIADAFLSTNPDLSQSVSVTAQENYFGSGGGDGSAGSPTTGQSVSLADALEQTLKYSSDTDANVLIDAAGGLQKINDTVKTLGYNNTTILSYYNSGGIPTISPNQTTVTDLTNAMEKIYVSSDPAYQKAHQYLHESTVNYGLSSDANKWGGTSSVSGNSAVFIVGSLQYIITVYIEKDWQGDKDASKPDSGATAVKNATTDLLAAIKPPAASSSSSGTTAGCCPTNSGSSTLVGGSNIEKAFRYLVQQGLTNEQAAGILGNLISESQLDPFDQEGGKTPPAGGYGIAQWTGTGAQNDPAGSRRIDLIKAMQAAGLQVNLSTQTSVEPPERANDLLSFELDYLWKEASARGDIDKIKATSSVQDAVMAWQKNYERAGVPRLGDRLTNGQDTFDTYANSSASTSANGAGGGSCTVGDNSKFVDGFLIYSQYDKAWADHAYASSTIAASGCGPSSMAMIITAFTGQRVTPIDTADYAASQHLYIDGLGSSHNIGPVLAEHWGLQSKSLSADAAAITDALRAGQLVIAPGKGAEPFTQGGHFIVIRAVLTDGNWKVGDSAHDGSSDKEWDPTQIIASIQANGGGGVYAIYK